MTNKSVTESPDREGREAVNAIDAQSAWREEVTASTARYSQTILDKMAAAATAISRHGLWSVPELELPNCARPALDGSGGGMAAQLDVCMVHVDRPSWDASAGPR